MGGGKKRWVGLGICDVHGILGLGWFFWVGLGWGGVDVDVDVGM